MGLTHLADVSGEKRFRDAILAMGRANQWQLGPRTYHADDHVIGQSYLWAATHGAGPEAIAPLKATLRCDPREAPRRAPELLRAAERLRRHGLPARAGAGATRCSWRRPRGSSSRKQTGDRATPISRWPSSGRRRRSCSTRPRICTSATAASSNAATTQGRKLFWSRGNGWVFAGIANMLDALPADDPHRVGIEKLFREMADKLKSLQKPDGYWAPSLLRPGELARRNRAAPASTSMASPGA